MPSTSPPAVTPLGYALLCEIRAQPRGGYALRRLFETTPLGTFSSSPSSIYPALRRLEVEGLIRAVGTGRGGRFEITASGEQLLQAWLAQPVTLDDVSRRLDLCMLRFAFLQGQPDPSIATGFLTLLAAAAKAREAELTAFLDGAEGKALPLHGRLAVEHGLRSIQTTASWAVDAFDRLNTEPKGEPA